MSDMTEELANLLRARKEQADLILDQAARRYAAADRSDPFALARVRMYIRNGISGFGEDGKPHTDAEAVTVTRVLAATGEEYPAVEYRNMRRA